MGADLADFGLELFKILEGFRTLAGVAEQCGGVVDRHHVDAGPVEPLPVLFGDLEILTNEAGGGNAAQTDDDFRPDERDLIAEVADACVHLHVQRVAILWGTAFDHIANEVLGAVQVDDGRPSYT